MNKHDALDAAEIFDSWRIVPRVFLAASFAWCTYLTDWLVSWYIHLPHAERGVEATGFASVVQIGVLGFLKLVFDRYSATARDWNDRPLPNSQTATTATVSTTTVTP